VEDKQVQQEHICWCLCQMSHFHQHGKGVASHGSSNAKEACQLGCTWGGWGVQEL
jgi:hypothetical protein